jgi:hypothetical protein
MGMGADHGRPGAHRTAPFRADMADGGVISYLVESRWGRPILAFLAD